MTKNKIYRILISLIIAGVIVFSIISILKFTGRHYYKAVFREAPGLKLGNKIFVLGIQVGKVSKIQLYDDSLVATFWVKGTKLKHGTALCLEPKNIFGDKDLILYHGKGDDLPSNSTIYGSYKKGISDAIVSLGSFVDHLDSLTNEMIHLASDAQRAFNETAKGLDKTISTVEREAVTTFKSIREITESTTEMLDKSTSSLTSTVENLRDISNHLKLLLQSADTSLTTGISAIASTTARLDTIASLLIAGKGTAGRLITSDTLYIRIDSTLTSLRELLEDIKKNPQRYLKIF